MSEPTTAPVAAATPATSAPSEATTPATKSERKANAVTALKEMLAAKAASAQAERTAIQAKVAPTATKAAEAAPAAVAETIEKIEDAGGKAPDQKAGESDTSYQLRLAKAFKEQRLANQKAEAAEKRASESTAELMKLKALFDKGKANPLEILEHLGVSFPDLVKGINDDKYKAPKKHDLPPEIVEKLNRLDKAEKEREEQRLAAGRQAERAGHERQVVEFIKANAERFPLASSLSNIEKTIVDHAYRKGQGDVEAILQELETNLEGEMLPVVTSEKALIKLLKSKPELKATIMKALGLSEPKAASEEEPSGASIGGMSTEPGTPPSRSSQAQRKAEAIALMKSRRSGK